MDDLREPSAEMAAAATIQKLEHAWEQLRREEVRRYGKKLTPEEAMLLEEMTKSLLQKVLRQPVQQAAGHRGETGAWINSLTELFDLEKQPAPLARR
ncbi:hypothetical protein [Hymenobacter chitinivorans]|uniref:hypothetical protein n=1 Tax=Hymenobacter chitinivorans TaxID=89969 RepID=UPI000C237ADA|nr:hypothetical protein [Hymenobacter chitinivorans]